MSLEVQKRLFDSPASPGAYRTTLEALAERMSTSPRGAHWQVSAPLWEIIQGGFGDRFWVRRWELRTHYSTGHGRRSRHPQRSQAHSIVLGFLALLGRSEPYGACRKPHLLVMRFRSPRADPRGMKTSRCAKRVRTPRGSDDASSLENGALMGVATGPSR